MQLNPRDILMVLMGIGLGYTIYPVANKRKEGANSFIIGLLIGAVGVYLKSGKSLKDLYLSEFVPQNKKG